MRRSSRRSSAECAPGFDGLTFTSKVTGLFRGSFTVFFEENVPSLPTQLTR